MPKPFTAKDRIVLALDVEDDRVALGLVDELKDVVGVFKRHKPFFSGAFSLEY